MSDTPILIIGSGHAGAHCAIALRQQGFEGRISIVSNEAHLPYERPPLSKDILTQDKGFDDIQMRPLSFWQEKEVEFVLGNAVDSLDPEAHTVRLTNCRELQYSQLVWAAGTQARKINCEGSELKGIFYIRVREDAEALLEAMPQAQNIVIVGGGYIGLEAAAALRKAGKQVTLLEAQDRVLARVAGEPLSRFYEEQHRDHGVDIRLNAAMAAIQGHNSQITGVVMKNGEILPADILLVGIGVIPQVAPLLDAGAVGSNGVDVDEYCRTSLPDVYAIGDCAAHHNRFADGARIRLESVQNAVDQAIVAAKHLTGTSAQYTATPWFWSNQYDLRLQTVGLSTGYDNLIIRGAPSERSFTLAYLKSGHLIALDCVNSTKDFIQGKKLVEARFRPDLGSLANGTITLSQIGQADS